MTNVYRQLAEPIRDEVETVGRVVSRALVAWKKAQNAPDDQAYVDSVALNLHATYGGVERLFEMIARHVDRQIPDGATWHRDLLRRMARDEGNLPPAVVSEDTAERLDELRRFRHLVRNVYTIELAPEKMVDLVAELPALWSNLRSELLAFAEFLEHRAAAE